MNLLVKGKYVISDKIIKDGAIAIEDNIIMDVGEERKIKRSVGRGYEVYGGEEYLVIPGLINSHTHISMTLLRGYADDYSLQDWLEKWIWPVEAKLRPEDIEAGAILGAVESISMGVTTVCSLYHYYPDRNEASGLLKVGMRGTIGTALFSWDKEKCIYNFRDALHRWHGKNNLIRIAIGPHAPYTVDPDLWIEAKELLDYANNKYADKGDIIMTTHILEDDKEPELVKEKFNVELPEGSVVRYLDKLGVLDNYMLAAHMIHLHRDDIEIVKKRGINIAHNPIANLKLGMGIAPVSRYIDRGINVSLGTDGPASNNTLDIFETMKIAALLQKAIDRDPTTLPAKKVFEMATINGAKALHYDNLGMIRKGYLADIVLIDLKKPHLKPIFDPYSHLVYSVRSLDVDTVIIDGKIVYEKGEFSTISYDDIYKKIDRIINRLMSA
jgi:5-methylthioadenosine/S-adenosylhomocysteine deaminase